MTGLHELLCGCKCVRKTGVMVAVCHDHAPKERRTDRVSSGAASKPAGCDSSVVEPARNALHTSSLVSVRPTPTGRGATAAEACPPHQRECETGLAGLALSAGEVPAGVAPSRPVGALKRDAWCRPWAGTGLDTGPNRFVTPAPRPLPPVEADSRERPALCSDHRTATAAAVVGQESRSLADGPVTPPCPGVGPASCECGPSVV